MTSNSELIYNTLYAAQQQLFKCAKTAHATLRCSRQNDDVDIYGPLLLSLYQD